MLTTTVQTERNIKDAGTAPAYELDPVRVVWYSLRWWLTMSRVAFGALRAGRTNRVVPVSVYAVARGNKAALTIMKRLSFAYPNSYPKIIAHFRYYEIKGYRIPQLYKAAGNNIGAFVSACTDMYELMQLVRKTKDSGNVPSRDVQLSAGQELQLKKQLIELNDPEILRTNLSWPLLLHSVDLHTDVKEAIEDFLLPDRISCAQWYINYVALRDERSFMRLQAFLSGLILSRPQKKAPFFPLWYLAGYPNVVQWALDPLSGSGLYDMTENLDGFLDHHQLRLLINSYDDTDRYQKKRKYDFHY